MAVVSASPRAGRAGSTWLLLGLAVACSPGCSYLRPPNPPLDRPAGIHDSPDSRYPANEYNNDSGRIVGQRTQDEPDGSGFSAALWIRTSRDSARHLS